jgi:hypothetical protein
VDACQFFLPKARLEQLPVLMQKGQVEIVLYVRPALVGGLPARILFLRGAFGRGMKERRERGLLNYVCVGGLPTAEGCLCGRVLMVH